MAESVDALVSNTSGATHPGSSPGLGTRLQKQSAANNMSAALFFVISYFSFVLLDHHLFAINDVETLLWVLHLAASEVIDGRNC